MGVMTVALSDKLAIAASLYGSSAKETVQPESVIATATTDSENGIVTISFPDDTDDANIVAERSFGDIPEESMTVDSEEFLIHVSEYANGDQWTFTYSDQNDSWLTDDTEVDLSDFGITIDDTVSPSDGDSFTVQASGTAVEVEVPCVGAISAGEQVVVTMGNDSPTVIGSAGWGDSIASDITGIANHFWTDDAGAHITLEEGSTEGKNVLIDSDSVDIRDGNTVLATFDASGVTQSGLHFGKTSGNYRSAISTVKGAFDPAPQNEILMGGVWESLIIVPTITIPAGQTVAYVPYEDVAEFTVVKIWKRSDIPNDSYSIFNDDANSRFVVTLNRAFDTDVDFWFASLDERGGGNGIKSPRTSVIAPYVFSVQTDDVLIVGDTSIKGDSLILGDQLATGDLNVGGNIYGKGAVPSGGDANQVLVKSTDDDYDYEWADVQGGGYTLPIASSTTLGGVKVGDNLAIDNSGILDATDTTYSAATTSADGLMSASDKTKLDGIESGANAYTLPIASDTTLGGVKVGSGDGLSVAEDGTAKLDPWTGSNLFIVTNSLEISVGSVPGGSYVGGTSAAHKPSGAANYYPIAVIGWESNTRYCCLYRLDMRDRAQGSVTVGYGVYNPHTNAHAVTLTIQILWCRYVY